MKLYLFWVYVISSQVAAIKVPIDSYDEKETQTSPQVVEIIKNKPIYYIGDGSQTENLFIPPNPPEIMHPGMEMPVTYLLPPSNEKTIDYYNPTESVEQSDWYPIAHAEPQTVVYPTAVQSQEPIEVHNNFRVSKVLERNNIPVPSRILLPPTEDARNFYFVDPALVESEQQSANLNKPAQPHKSNGKLIGPHPHKHNIRHPTALYPKKFVNGFNPVPIPIAQYSDGSLTEIPKAKPVKPIKPIPSIDGIYLTPVDDKRIYKYEQEEHKRKHKQKQGEQINNMGTPMAEAQNNDYKQDHRPPSEQETSETNHDQPEPDHVKPKSKVRQVYVPANKGERTEFRMHGMNGPHSYQFGYDTGKGKNRQFRFEERDNDGHVRGHYGYVDKFGKTRVVNYDADPELGFRAEAPVVQE